MATATTPTTPEALEPERRFLLPGVGWAGYEALLGAIGDGRTRVTYDRGDVELMSPSHHHEFYKTLLGWMIETLFEELDVPYEAAGSTSWRSQAAGRGLEADECYYVSNLELVRRKRNRIDLEVDPAPDLAVEVEISRSALDRMGVYAALGVREVWRFDGEALVIERLEPGGTYVPAPASDVVPALSAGDVARWVRSAETADTRPAWNRQFRAWVRAELIARREGR